MDTTTFPTNATLESQPGVIENPNGGYHIHVQLNEREPDTTHNRLLNPCPAMPPSTPVLLEMSVFEDCVLFTLQDSAAIVMHVDDPRAAGSVVFFYHADGTLWRAVPLEQLNPGWVSGTYRFRGDLRKFDARLARVRSRPARPSHRTRPTFWATGAWQDAVVCAPLGLVWRIRDWQHSSLSEPQVTIPGEEQTKQLSQAYPSDVQQLLAVREQCEKKGTYQIGGLNLLLNYVERIGLVEIVNRYCPRDGEISDGTVIAVLVINRLLSPCALRRISEWVDDVGLHLLLGIADPEMLNYDRLSDALLAVHPHWQTIATEITLQAVEEFQLKIDTIHYDLTSVFFHGEYEGSAWVTFGYSRDKRPDKRQVNIGVSATADGEVVLPGGSSVHSGDTNDGTTTVPTHERLHKLFQRSDLLVTGDSIMHNAKNMLLISRAHGRFLGPPEMTKRTRRVVAACSEDEFATLPASTKKADHEVKAVFRRLLFEAKLKMTPAERDREAARRKRLGIGGRRPVYRKVHYWMRAAIILDTERQKTDAKRRRKRIEAYESKLKYTLDRLHKRNYYNDPEWVDGHLADLAHQFKDVRAFVKVDFAVQDGQMSLAYERRPDRIAEAAKLDGRWVLVTNQRREQGQAVTDYLDWMWTVYKNHRHVERRMRNLKSDLPIRPIYLHRDDAIVSLCFVGVVALMVYTLVERDCQANPVMVDAGLRTTDEVLNVLGGYCVGVHLTASGYEVFWPDTPTEKQKMIWRQLQIPDPGTRVPDVRQVPPKADLTPFPTSFSSLEMTNGDMVRLRSRLQILVLSLGICPAPQFWIG
ncbi:MAG: IS1634 family transposase, partial [Chloroflexota bacterium]|nr:IS1634 family transposase [Chloroflexota bacterium]